METGGRTRAETPTHRATRNTALALTLLFVLAAVSVSSGLVVYTAWKGDLANGIFAILFAVLSAKSALSWMLWHGNPDHHEPPK